jgi:hypothetical protein
MPIKDFCTVFNLSANILGKLEENGYTDARMFRFVLLSELKDDMGFKLGETAALRDAVEGWSVLKEV